MNKVNYQKQLDGILEQIRVRTEEGERQGVRPAAPPTLFLHSCCAPCSSYVLEYLSRYFAITVFYFNPNITEAEEYIRRVEEQKSLIRVMNERNKAPGERAACGEDMVEGENEACGKGGSAYRIGIVEGAYRPEDFLKATAGMEHVPEGGERCSRCFLLRLEETAAEAARGGYDYFATTLTISPMKDAQRLNRIGKAMGDQYGVSWLFSDFKKKNGYKRSVELSHELGLYRQDYCGCEYSRRASRAESGMQEQPAEEDRLEGEKK